MKYSSSLAALAEYPSSADRASWAFRIDRGAMRAGSWPSFTSCTSQSTMAVRSSQEHIRKVAMSGARCTSPYPASQLANS